MEAETARIEATTAALGHKIANLENEVRTLKEFFIGKELTTITVPSGVDGFNFQFGVMAQPLGVTPADDGSFICGYDSEKNILSVGPGSYQFPLGTNIDVKEIEGGGTYAYAVIEQTKEGGLKKFKIEVTSKTKDSINMSSDEKYVQFSNVLLAEVVDGEAIQRRVGNLSLIYRIINGTFCLWTETTGGSTLVRE